MYCVRGGMLLLIAGLLLSGCASFASFAATLDQRQIQSCIKWQGFVGGGWAGGQVQVMGMTATGGVKLNQCLGGGGE